VLCGAGSMVPQCKNETAIANLPTANDTQQAVFSMCQSMPGMNGCDHCSPTAPAGMAMAQSLQVQCPNPLMSLSALCLSSPMGGCSIWTSFCNATMTAGGAAGFPSLCSAAPMGPTMAPGPQMDMMSGPGGANGDGGSHGQVSGSMMDGGMGGPSPCETDPTQPSCAGYEMPDSEASADIMNMCQEMPNMVGCSLWSECEVRNYEKEGGK